jgi:hypothetical protein
LAKDDEKEERAGHRSQSEGRDCAKRRDRVEIDVRIEPGQREAQRQNLGEAGAIGGSASDGMNNIDSLGAGM